MESRLSALKYVRNNKKQSGVMIVALALTFMTMYIINFLFLTTEESFKEIFLEQPKKVAFVDLSANTMGIEGDTDSSDEERSKQIVNRINEIIDRLKKLDGISDVTYTQILDANYKAIVGNIGYRIPLYESEQIPEYLKHMDAKLVEGNMPKKAGEVLVDKKVFSNQQMSIGGYFNESLYGKTFKVSGVIESDNLTCVGIPQGYTNSGWCIVVQCDSKSADMNKELKKLGIVTSKYDRIYDVQYWADAYKSLVEEQIDAALLVILIVVMIFLAISIMVAYISFMRSRTNEYCLYTSIGFNRKDIYTMMMREVGIIFGSSLIFGAVITIVIMVLLGNILLDNLGLVYKYFYPEHLVRILAAFMAIVGFLQIPVIFTINSIKTIDLIEE